MGARGDVAEWLGRGLQSLVQRFESARRLSPGRGRSAPAGHAVVVISGSADLARLSARGSPGLCCSHYPLGRAHSATRHGRESAHYRSRTKSKRPILRPFTSFQPEIRHSDVKIPSLRLPATPGKKSCVVSTAFRGACTFTWMCFVLPG